MKLSAALDEPWKLQWPKIHSMKHYAQAWNDKEPTGRIIEESCSLIQRNLDHYYHLDLFHNGVANMETHAQELARESICEELPVTFSQLRS